MEKFIGKTFIVKGFNELRIVKIESIYYLGGLPKYPAFKCRVMGNYLHFKDGDKENFLCKDLIHNDKLVKSIKVLSA